MSRAPTPSVYQQAILSELGKPGDHLVIMATAGAGKTTVLVQAAQLQPDSSRQMFLAFARDAAAELRRRLPPGVDTRTVHSLGRYVLASHLKGRGIGLSPPQPGKYRRIVHKLLKEAAPGQADSDTVHFLVQLTDMVRLQLADGADHDSLAQLVSDGGLWLPVPTAGVDRLFALVPRVLELGLLQAERGLVDFGDMLFVPVKKRLPVPAFDLVAIDEAQDYSPVALELTLSLAAAGARLVFVGDPRQSIFGFAGADPDAMQLISSRLAAKVLPLSVTYRCPRLHVELARELAPEIEPAPDAPAGSLRVISDDELDGQIGAGDLVLCRLNAPLIAVSLRLTASGIPAFVRGADLQQRLSQLAQRVFKRGVNSTGVQLQAFLKSELRRMTSADTQAPPLAAARLRDEISSLTQLCTDLPDPADLETIEARIESLFGRKPGSVILSSIHRAKGQEANRVILLYPEMLPAPYARSIRALRGEACVQFVALTRAREELVIVQAAGTQIQPTAGEPFNDGSDDAERERLLHAWERVLQKARAGRRYRSAEGRSTIRSVPARP